MAEWIIEVKDGKFPIGKWTKLVRCKDCKHHEDEEPAMVYCPNIVGGWVREDFYCGRAKGETMRLIDADELYKRTAEWEEQELIGDVFWWIWIITGTILLYKQNFKEFFEKLKKWWNNDNNKKT